MTDLSRSAADHDLATLQARVLRRRQLHARTARGAAPFTVTFAGHARRLLAHSRHLPARYVLHLLVGMLVPLAMLASQIPLAPQFETAPAMSVPNASLGDLASEVAPLSLSGASDGDTPAPDSAFATIDALPITSLPHNLLDPQPIAATIVAESANIRGGPGTNYDKIGALPAGTALQVVARTENWYQARTGDGSMIWIAAELLNLDTTAANLLPEPASIPAPPPLKIGLVAEEGLNLRDGPSTAYVGLTKLKAGVQLDLLARYGEWFQVQTPEGQAGWVLGQYLAIGSGVVDRVEAVSSVPSLNPSLLGVIRERNVNLRGGPGVAYDKLGALDTGTQLDLLGRYDEWFKVRTPRGTVGWVSNELLDVSAFVARRVPVARNIPALAQARPANQARGTSRPTPVSAAAAGSVVRFATQFVGARYAWGGTGPNAFDCSGFTSYVYQQFGLALPHSSAGQYSTRYGTLIADPTDLRPGDIVFFVNTYKRGISHVGIYVGGGDVVQALSPRLGVGVANLNGGYWTQHYYGAIRPAK